MPSKATEIRAPTSRSLTSVRNFKSFGQSAIVKPFERPTRLPSTLPAQSSANSLLTIPTANAPTSPSPPPASTSKTSPSSSPGISKLSN